MTEEEKLDQLIKLMKQQNKMLGNLGLIVARISTLILVLVIIFIVGVILIFLF